MPKKPKKPESGETTAERIRRERAEKLQYTPLAKKRIATYLKNAYTHNVAIGIVQPATLSPNGKKSVVVYDTTDNYIFTMGYNTFQYSTTKNSWRFLPTHTQRTKFYNDRCKVLAIFEHSSFESRFKKWGAYILARDANREYPPTRGEFLEALLLYGIDRVNDWAKNNDAFNIAPDGIVNGMPYQIGYEGKQWATDSFLQTLDYNKK